MEGVVIPLVCVLAVLEGFCSLQIVLSNRAVPLKASLIPRPLIIFMSDLLME